VSRADDEDPTLPPEEEAALLEALEAALRPEPLDPATAERILEIALEDPLAEPTAEELAQSERLREALATGAPHADDAVLSALRAPFASTADDELRLERALKRARVAPSGRGKVVYAWFGAAGVALAAAAAIVLFVAPPRQEQSPAAAMAPVLVRPHSTTDLFADRFETSGTSERIDLIASARGRDLRDNRYAAWGVR